MSAKLIRTPSVSLLATVRMPVGKFSATGAANWARFRSQLEVLAEGFGISVSELMKGV